MIFVLFQFTNYFKKEQLVMKNLIFSAAVVAASVFGVYTANQNSAMANLSALQMENIEALGGIGDGEHNSNCPYGCVAGYKGCTCGGFYDYYSDARH